MQHFLRSLREVSIYYITICHLHFQVNLQLIEFNHVKPIFQLLLLSNLNMPPNTKTEILDISSCKIHMFMHIPRILYVWIYLFSKQNRKNY